MEPLFPSELVKIDAPIKKKLLGITEYEQRLKLHNDMHVGVCELINSPTQVSHLVLLCDSNLVDQERVLIAQLCERYGVTPPTVYSTHFVSEMGSFRFKWERHTEYSTYTVYYSAPFAEPFSEPAIHYLPKEWLESLPGEVIVGVHLALEDKEHAIREIGSLAALFASNTVIGSKVAAGRAVVWTDNQIHSDGFGRVLIQDLQLGSRQAGRLVKRLIEIETYRILAMLSIPLTRQYIPELVHYDTRLASISTSNTQLNSVEDEQNLLKELSQLASEIQEISARTSHRFNASKVYYSIVQSRIFELREERIEGLQMFHEFMDQRLSSSMITCDLVHNKLETLSTRVERASALLRTRVDITMEEQSRDLLKSMDRRASLQLRLQETVEGLSIVVLSYYLLGLISYGLKALKASGIKFNTEIVTGLAVPLVIGLVFFSVRRLRRKLEKAHQ
ncbi:MAG: DUF3422 domain-containing protein [Gammaproteobacteria bacterium]|nr:DUF3422 domain-containing protein [Gammaproteobacteria bacterium]